MKRPMLLRMCQILVAGLAFSSAQAQTKAADRAETVVVDKIVANPAKFKGVVNVEGRVTKTGANGLFSLGCDDACVAMPVKFAGTLPPVGSNVIVRGQVGKDPSGRYLFSAESVNAKK